MKYLPPNGSRALTGVGAIICIAIGAGMLWGGGGVFFATGLFMAIDCSVDEIVERVTNTTRHKL